MHTKNSTYLPRPTKYVRKLTDQLGGDELEEFCCVTHMHSERIGSWHNDLKKKSHLKHLSQIGARVRD